MRYISLALLLTVVSGCGGASDLPPLAPVVGIVMLDGKPARNLTVEFYPDNSANTTGPVSSGVTNTEGYFELFTAAGEKGAVIGTHKVVVKCPFTLQGRLSTGDGFGSSASGAAPEAPKEVPDCNLALHFEEPTTTPLSQVVPKDGLKDIVIQTTSAE